MDPPSEPGSKYIWIRGIPALNRPFPQPAWVSFIPYRDPYLLQAAYFDRFGDGRPSLGAKHKARDPYMRVDPEEVSKAEHMDSFCEPLHVIPLSISRDSEVYVPVDEPYSYFVNEVPMAPIVENPREVFKRDLRATIEQQADKFAYLADKVQTLHSLRIFLSSPFLGCEAERRQFSEIYFPVLNAFCQRKGIYLSVVDFSWGISDHMVSNFLTIRTCMQAIDSSDLFLGYYGARYGSSISSGAAWIGRSIDECAGMYPYLHQYKDRSATEIEWLHAFLHRDHCRSKDKPLSFFFFRDALYDSSKAEELKDTEGASMYQTENESSRASLEALRVLTRERVQTTQCGAFVEAYDSPSEGAKLMFECCEFIVQKILEKVETQSAGADQRLMHLSFARFKTGLYIQPDDLRREMDDFVCFAVPPAPPSCLPFLFPSPRPALPPLVVSGGSGLGKSSLMASLVLSPPPKLRLIYHFVGCNRGSSFLRPMLTRLYHEFLVILAEVFANAKSLPSPDKIETNKLFSLIAELVEDHSLALPTIVFVIDAINELDNEAYNDQCDRPSGLLWLPRSFPPKMRVVLSCLSKSGSCDGRMVNTLSLRGAHFIEVAPLSVELRRKVVQKWHSSYLKSVDERLMCRLWEHGACENPMYLSLVVKGLISYGSYSTLAERIDRYLRTDSIPDLLLMVIEDVGSALILDEREGSRPDIVQSILQLISCSREGLSSAEIIELLQNDLTQKPYSSPTAKRLSVVTQSSWTVISYLMQQLIFPRHGLYNFTHDYVRQAVEYLYFREGGEALFHRRLALFFKLRGNDSDYSMSFTDDYPRSTRELLFHEREAGIRPSVIVATRIRPFSPQEIQFSSDSIVKVKRNQVMVVSPHTSQPSIFVLDTALDSSSPKLNLQQNQAAVASTCIESVISQAMNGYNASVFAYGATGSGKSYTMFGTAKSPGVIPCLLVDLLSKLDARKRYDGVVSQVSCTMVEVYGNEVYDLLGATSSKIVLRVSASTASRIAPASGAEVNVSIRKSSSKAKESVNEKSMKRNSRSLFRKSTDEESKSPIDSSTSADEPAEASVAATAKSAARDVQLEGATSLQVHSYAEARNLLDSGLAKRRTSETRVNADSSRSHCIFTLHLTQCSRDGSQTKTSKISLVDLAGNERVSKSLRKGKQFEQTNAQLFKEAIATNKSLSILNNCIRALCDQKSTYIPYRDSALTWMLQDSFGGKATTFFIATVSPSPQCYSETVSTLQYASQAKRIPNELTTDQALLEEAEKDRLAEGAARVALCSKYGFSESHLEKLREFYKNKEDVSFQWLDPSSTTWVKELRLWEGIMQEQREHEKNGAALHWAKGFEASCFDCADQRCLKAYPGEFVTIKLVFSHIPAESTGAEISCFQIAIDFASVHTVSRSTQEHKLNDVSTFSLAAPDRGGLYMIRSRLSTDETSIARTYAGSEGWYSNFIAWLVVLDARPSNSLISNTAARSKMVWCVAPLLREEIKELLNLKENSFIVKNKTLSTSERSASYKKWFALPFLSAKCIEISIKCRLRCKGAAPSAGRIGLRLLRDTFLFATHFVCIASSEWQDVAVVVQNEPITRYSEPGDVYEIMYCAGTGQQELLVEIAVELVGTDGPPTVGANIDETKRPAPAASALTEFGFSEPDLVSAPLYPVPVGDSGDMLTYPSLPQLLSTAPDSYGHFRLRSALSDKVLAEKTINTVKILELVKPSESPNQFWTLSSTQGIVCVASGLSICKYQHDEAFDASLGTSNVFDKHWHDGLGGTCDENYDVNSHLELVHFPNSPYFCIASKLLVGSTVLMEDPSGGVTFTPPSRKLNQLWSVEIKSYNASASVIDEVLLDWTKVTSEIFSGDFGLVSCVAYHPSEHQIMVGADDGKVHVLSASSGVEVKGLQGHSRALRGLCFNRDETRSRIASCSEDKHIVVWKTVTGAKLLDLEGHSNSVLAVDFSPSGTHIASGSIDGTIRLWDSHTGEALSTLHGNSRSINAVKFLGNDRIVSGSDDMIVRVWNVSSKSVMHSLKGHSGGVLGLAVTRDEALVASCATDFSVRIWDLASFTDSVLSGHSNYVTSVCFTIDAKFLASSSWDNSVKVWSVANGQLLNTLLGHTHYVTSVCFNQSGSRLVSGSEDRTVRVWEPASSTRNAKQFASYALKDRSLSMSNGDDAYHRWFSLPYLKSSCAEMAISFRMKDQGWGGSKGALAIRGLRVVDGLTVVFSFFLLGTATHDWKTFSFVFRDERIVSLSRPGDVYELLYIVGAGDYFVLTIEDFSIELKGIAAPPTADGLSESSPSRPATSAVDLSRYGFVPPEIIEGAIAPSYKVQSKDQRVSNLNALYIRSALTGKVLDHSAEDASIVFAGKMFPSLRVNEPARKDSQLWTIFSEASGNTEVSLSCSNSEGGLVHFTEQEQTGVYPKSLLPIVSLNDTWELHPYIGTYYYTITNSKTRENLSVNASEAVYLSSARPHVNQLWYIESANVMSRWRVKSEDGKTLGLLIIANNESGIAEIRWNGKSAIPSKLTPEDFVVAINMSSESSASSETVEHVFDVKIARDGSRFSGKYIIRRTPLASKSKKLKTPVAQDTAILVQGFELLSNAKQDGSSKAGKPRSTFSM